MSLDSKRLLTKSMYCTILLESLKRAIISVNKADMADFDLVHKPSVGSSRAWPSVGGFAQRVKTVSAWAWLNQWLALSEQLLGSFSRMGLEDSPPAFLDRQSRALTIKHQMDANHFSGRRRPEYEDLYMHTCCAVKYV